MPSRRGDVDRAAVRQVELLRPGRAARGHRHDGQRGGMPKQPRPAVMAMRRSARDAPGRRTGSAVPLSVTVKPCASSVPNGPSAWVGSAPAAAPAFRSIEALAVTSVVPSSRYSVTSCDRSSWLAVLQVDALSLDCTISQVPLLQRDVALRRGQVDPFRSVLLRGRGGDRVGAALVVHAVVAGVGQRGAAHARQRCVGMRCGACPRGRDRTPATARWSRAAAARRPAAATWSA